MPGRGGQIEDAGRLTAAELQAAMRVQEAPELDAEGEDNFAEPLGLRYHEGRSLGSHTYGRTAKPAVLYGTRHGRQVYVRIGWLGEGPPLYFLMLRRARLRYVTVARVQAPNFQLVAAGGRFTGDAATPPEVAGALTHLGASPAVWSDLRVLSGSEGIVVSRRIPSRPGGGEWTHDLWLVELLSDALNAAPLPNKKMTRSWTVPYGLGERVPR